jgi:hypothetical protein
MPVQSTAIYAAPTWQKRLIDLQAAISSPNVANQLHRSPYNGIELSTGKRKKAGKKKRGATTA